MYVFGIAWMTQSWMTWLSHQL